MRHYREQQRTEKVLDRVLCDLCDKQAGDGGVWPASQGHREHTIQIEHEMQNSCSDGGSGLRLSLDVCPECFTGKVLPALRTQGLTRDYEEFDW